MGGHPQTVSHERRGGLNPATHIGPEGPEETVMETANTLAGASYEAARTDGGRESLMGVRIDRSLCVDPECAMCHRPDRARDGLKLAPPVRGPFTDVCGCRYCGCRWSPAASVFRGGFDTLLAWAHLFGDSYTHIPLLLSWKGKVPRRLFLRLLGEIWIDCDNIEHPKYFKGVWALLPDRPCWSMMEPNDREALKALPETVVVYRGAGKGPGEYGPSWSLDRHVAAAFPFLDRYRAAVPILLTGRVRRPRIAALKLGRDEFEVVSKHVVVTDRERLKRPPTRRDLRR